MLETAIREEKCQEALERIQNTVRNAKAIVTEYVNDYVNGKYNAATSVSVTGELLRMVGQKINEHIKTIENA